MADDLHACALLLLVIVWLGITIWNRGEEVTPESRRRALLAAIPYILLAVLSGVVWYPDGYPLAEWLIRRAQNVPASDVSRWHGFPVTEWLIPGACVIISTATGRRKKVVRIVNVCIFLSALLLWSHSMLLLRSGNYTANPGVIDAANPGMILISRGELHNRHILRAAWKKLEYYYGEDAEFPAGLLGKTLPERGTWTDEEWEVVPLWHTPLTCLHFVKRVPVAIWYPGGKVREARDRLELRPL